MTQETKALIERLSAFSHDYPCIHCGSGALKINSRGQIICLLCLGENPSDEKGQLMAQAADALEAAQKRIDELEGVLRRYRNETPLGHQPHMIAEQADAALKGKGGE